MLDSGDSTLIISPHGKTILIDGGEEEKNVLVPYLLARKIKKIDYLVISHFDSDHVGGIFSVIMNLKVGKVIISKQKEDSENYQRFIKMVKQKNIKVLVMEKGDKIIIDNDLFFDVLWPLKLINENVLNNNSLVLKLCYKDFSMIFTGDIEEIAESEILKEYEKNISTLKATILKVAHHGSKTSSTQEFISKVKPQISLIGVEKNNKFGHPNEEVIERLEKIGSKIYRTDLMGEIKIVVNKKGKINIYKKLNYIEK